MEFLFAGFVSAFVACVISATKSYHLKYTAKGHQVLRANRRIAYQRRGLVELLYFLALSRGLQCCRLMWPRTQCHYC